MKSKYQTPRVDVFHIEPVTIVAGSTHATIPNAGWDNDARYTGAIIPDAGWDNAASSRASWSDYEQ